MGDVIQGKKSVKQVLQEFLSGFEGDSTGRGDGKVTWTEFLGYYTDLSGSIPSEQYFVELITKVWSVKNNNTDSKVRDLCSLLREKVAQRTKTGRNGSDTLLNAFKFFDEDESSFVGKNEFSKALERFGVILSESDTQTFFRVFD